MYVVPLGRHFKPHYPVFIGRFTTPCRFVGRPFRATITLRPFGRLSTPCRPEDRPTNRLTKPTIFVGLKTDLQGNDFVGRPFRATITLRPFGRLSTPCRPEDRPTNRLTKPTIFVGLKTDLQTRSRAKAATYKPISTSAFGNNC